MITLEEQPGVIAFTRNPILLRLLATDNTGTPYGAKGVREVMEVTSTGFAINSEIFINITEPGGGTINITMVAKLAPSNVNHFPANTGTVGLSYYEAVAGAIRSHPELGGNYKCYAATTTGGFSITLEAIEIDSDYIIAVSSTATNVTAINDYPIEPDNTPDDYAVEVEVFCENGYQTSVYNKIATLQQRPSADGRAVFNVAEILNGDAERTLAVPPIPAPNVTAISRATVTRRYYLRYRERIEGTPIPFQSLAVKKCLLGGIAQNIFPDYDFLGAMADNNSLLSFYPSGKKVASGERIFLHWFNYTGVTKNIALEVRERTADPNASPTTKVVYAGAAPTLGILANEVATIPIGITELNIAPTTIKYTVRVISRLEFDDTNTKIYLSQAMSYYVDNTYYPSVRYIHYLNAFSLPESLRCVGNFKQSLELNRTIAERTLAPNYSAATPQIVDVSTDWNYFFTYRSGFLSRLEVNSLQELFINNQAYETYAEGYIPLSIRTTKVDVEETDQELFFVTIEAEPRLKARNYSNITIAAEGEQVAWRTSLDSYWKTIFGASWKLS